MEPEKSVDQLEEENELLRSQLKAVMGDDQRHGVLMAQGMTQRQAQILHILIHRAPAVVSRDTLHILFYGDRSDGGPEPKIFDVQVSRLRMILRREECPGKIDTVWNAGYRADPALVKWALLLFGQHIQKEA